MTSPRAFLLQTMTLLAALALATATTPAAASAPRLGVIDVAGVLYVDDENAVLGNGVWIWMESNGQAGLQRGGCSIIVPDDCWPCRFYYDCEGTPDTLLF